MDPVPTEHYRVLTAPGHATFLALVPASFRSLLYTLFTLIIPDICLFPSLGKATRILPTESLFCTTCVMLCYRYSHRLSAFTCAAVNQKLQSVFSGTSHKIRKV